MSLFNPWVILGILSLLFTTFGGGYWKGTNAERQRQELEIAALNAKARETEQAMAKVAQSYGDTLRKANNAARVKEDKLRSDLADGALKLRVAVKAPQCPISATSDPAPPSGDNSGTASAELDRQTAESLIAIAAEGDAAIRKLNACIQTYDQMRNMK